jgi:hypothetical protein
MGGVSYIEFVLQGDVYEVFGGFSAYDAMREQIGQVPMDGGWRARLQFLVDQAEPAHEDHSTSEVSVRGGSPLEKAMLALAWSGPEGANAARTLLGLRDDEIETLGRQGRLSDEAASTLSLLNELELEEGDDIAIVRELLTNGNFDWGKVAEQAKQLVACCDQS